jgi:hyperosmotically inducible protein
MFMNKTTGYLAAALIAGSFSAAVNAGDTKNPHDVMHNDAAAADNMTDVSRTPAEFASDTALTAKVKAELAADPTAKAHQIDVETNQGIVQLNGFVDSDANRVAAEHVAADVDGVAEVRNNLRVRSQDSAGAIIDDSVITAKVKAALIENATTKGHEINVETQNGVVQLSGFVDTSAQKTAATSVVQTIEGVSDVNNDIDVKPKS